MNDKKSMSEYVIPEHVFTYFPFKPEPISKWNKKSDLYNFLLDLFDAVEYPEYGSYIFNNGLESQKSLALLFQRKAKEAPIAPASKDKKRKSPNFIEFEKFGLLSKCWICWDAIMHSCLSENALFSLAHILEAEEDLGCSIHLASNLYYKQASQVIRSFIENLVVPIYFCANPNKFTKWKDNSSGVPLMRQKKGLLDNLESKSILSEDVSKKISSLYGELNRFIHGSENRLIHRGIFSGNWIGRAYKQEEFEIWCNQFSSAVYLGARLLKINIDLWEKTKPKDKIICSVCHSEDFDISVENSKIDPDSTWIDDELELTTYTCRNCGNQMHFSNK